PVTFYFRSSHSFPTRRSSDLIFPTGYMAAENCNIQSGDTVAVWGCGPVGLFAIKSAFLLGAERVIAIDRVPERLEKARQDCRAEDRKSTRLNSSHEWTSYAVF